MTSKIATALVAISLVVHCQEFITDPGTYGPPIEVSHAYYDQWPTGIAVSKSGRLFSNYPAGLDANNTNDGTNGRYQVAELTTLNSEVPYPSAEINNPPEGAINRTTSPPTGANYNGFFIGVQSVVIDGMDRLWVLDTGRAIDPQTKQLVTSTYGGPKLIGINLTTDTIIKTILFPPTVAFPDSYLNDVRFDLRPDVTQTKSGVAYITDSSTEGRNGIVIVDLESGESWRHLTGTKYTRAETGFVPFVWGQAIYSNPAPSSQPIGYLGIGSDGIAISADGEDLYFCPLSSRTMYSISTSLLRSRSQTSELMAIQGVRSRSEKGFSDGFETDTNGFIYMGQFEQNAITLYNPANGTTSVFVRDPRINWVDTMSVGTDGYLYFTVNQLQLTPSFLPGTDRRIKPFALFRAKLPNGGTKVVLT